MKKISILTLISSLFLSTFVIANEVNVFNARHYKADLSFILSLQI